MIETLIVHITVIALYYYLIGRLSVFSMLSKVEYKVVLAFCGILFEYLNIVLFYAYNLVVEHVLQCNFSPHCKSPLHLQPRFVAIEVVTKMFRELQQLC